jgi:ABC-type transport system substrate-binding protein
MSWERVACAVSYNVYRVTAAGDHTLVQNTKEPMYTLYFDTGSTAMSDFAVKAICADGVESADFTQVARVQTGPGATAILIIIAGILGAVILRKKSLS